MIISESALRRVIREVLLCEIDDEHLLNEGLSDHLKMFTMGALIALGSNLVKIDRVEGKTNEKAKISAKETSDKIENYLDSQLIKDLDESASAIVMLLSRKGHKFRGDKRSKEVLRRNLYRLYPENKKEVDIYLEFNFFSVGKRDVEKIMNNAIVKAKKEGKKKVDIRLAKQVSVQTSSWEGKELDNLLSNEVRSKIVSNFNKINDKNMKIFLKKVKSKKQKRNAVEALNGLSRYYQKNGINSNNIKSFVLLIQGFDLNKSSIVQILKTSGKRSYGANLNPKVNRVLRIMSLILDFSLADEELQNMYVEEIFSTKEGVECYSLIRSIFMMGYGFHKKFVKAINKVKTTHNIDGDLSTASAIGNPKLLNRSTNK